MNLAELLSADQIRRGVTLPPVREREGAIVSYRVILVGVLREIGREAERSVVPAYRQASPLTQDALVTDEAEWFESLKFTAAYAIAVAISAMRTLFQREGDQHAKRFLAAVKRATRIDLPARAVTDVPAYERMMRVSIERNASLITSLGDDAVKRIEQQVYAARMSGLAARRSVQSLRREIREGLNVSRSRADLIAADQMASLNSQLAEHRSRQTGIERYVWNTRADGRVREAHVNLRGKIYKWGERTDAPSGGPPGSEIRCFPGETKVRSLSGVHRLFRRRYRGDATVITTESDAVLESTPNHPHLTARGWVAADSINVSDHLFHVGGKGALALDADTEHGKVRFDELFELAQVAFGLEVAGGSASDFHGDGIADHDVDVVDIEGGLRDARESLLAKGVKQGALAVAEDDRLGLLSSLSGVDPSGPRVGLASLGVVGVLRESFSVLRGEPGHAQDVRLRAIAKLYALALKVCGHRGAANAVALAEREHAVSGGVLGDESLHVNVLRVVCGAVVMDGGVAGLTHPFADDIGADPERALDLDQVHAVHVESDAVVDVQRREFSAHVYNLETVSGWYIANGLITKNCRCTPVPIIPGQSAAINSVEEQQRAEARNSAAQRRIASRRRR